MKILLAVDGSEQSYEAARALTGLAPADGLTVLTVVTVPGLSYPTLGAGLAKDLSMQVEQAMREEAEKILDQTVSLLPPHPGPVTKKLELGAPAEVILHLAKEKDCDLIVLGARGVGQFHEQMFGSVSHRVMTHAHCSTLIVKGHLRKLDHILLPVANQEDGDAAVNFLRQKPFRDSVKISVLHVIPFSQPVWPVGSHDSGRFPKRNDGTWRRIHWRNCFFNREIGLFSTRNRRHGGPVIHHLGRGHRQFTRSHSYAIP